MALDPSGCEGEPPGVQGPFTVLAVASIAGGCASEAAPLTVLAAASAKGPVTEAAETFGRDRGVAVRVIPGATSGLVRQIEAGAAADVVVSADRAWIDHLARGGHVRAGDERGVASNRLVLVAPVERPFRWTPGEPLDQVFDGALALAAEEVPAGRYARKALRGLGALDPVRDRVVSTPDAPAVVARVALGAAGAGIAYATDVSGRTDVAVVAELPPALHPPVLYLVAPLARAPHSLARDLAAWLASDRGRAPFRAAGFADPP